MRPHFLSACSLSHGEILFDLLSVSWSEYDTNALTATVKPADKTGSGCGALLLPMKCSG